MPSLNFQKEFVPGVRAMLDKTYAKRTGVKPKSTTIRALRKRPIRKGDKLFLFTAMRTKQCQRLGTVVCRRMETVDMEEGDIMADMQVHVSISIDGIRLTDNEAELIARKDGFENWEEMTAWFKKMHGIPFTGQRIHMANTYDRKYFCNKKVKDHGFALQLETTHKTINVHQEDVEAARGDRYVKELAEKYNYGIQIINPLFR